MILIQSKTQHGLEAKIRPEIGRGKVMLQLLPNASYFGVGLIEWDPGFQTTPDGDPLIISIRENPRLVHGRDLPDGYPNFYPVIFFDILVIGWEDSHDLKRGGVEFDH
ncbi:MAG TPA: hypothetical protein VGM64_06855 [Lacunisphaera sp.]